MKSDKHRERELAFQVLYGLSFAPAHNASQLEQAFMLSPHNPHSGAAPSGLSWQLIHGAWEKEKELDQEIEHFSRNWRPERIGRIERLLLRLALYEILHTSTPPKVVISESLELANQFGVDNARSFINGILDAAARKRLAADSGSAGEDGGQT